MRTQEVFLFDAQVHIACENNALDAIVKFLNEWKLLFGQLKLNKVVQKGVRKEGVFWSAEA